MITKIEPEKGGEQEGILRVELSMPLTPTELFALRNWLDDEGWVIEVEQIDAFFERQADPYA